MSNQKVLVVDDVEAMRQLLRAILETMGLPVVEAASGKETIEILSKDQGQIGLVLLDIELTDMNAFELIEKMRATHAKIPKISLVSGLRDKASVTKGLQLGVSDYIVKPVDRTVVVEKVNKLLGLKVQTPKAAGRVGANLQATITSLPNQVDLNITEISDLSCIAVSPIEFKSDPTVTLNIPGLKKHIGSELNFTARIVGCKTEKNQHVLELKFVGLPASVTSTLKYLVEQGKKVA